MKSTSKVTNLQVDIQVLSKMYISCQAREGELNKFLEHENHTWRPSLASNNTMHQTNKLDLLEYLESLVHHTDYGPNEDVRIVDGAALVHCLDPKKSKHSVKYLRNMHSSCSM